MFSAFKIAKEGSKLLPISKFLGCKNFQVTSEVSKGNIFQLMFFFKYKSYSTKRPAVSKSPTHPHSCFYLTFSASEISSSFFIILLR